MLGALQRIAHINKSARGRHLARQVADRGRIDFGNARRPVRVFRLPVCLAQQIPLELCIADRELIQRFEVVQFLDDQRVREAKHQRGVGARRDRQPGDIHPTRQVVANGPDQHEARAALGRPTQRSGRNMLAVAAAAHHHIAHRNAAEGHAPARCVRRAPAKPCCGA